MNIYKNRLLIRKDPRETNIKNKGIYGIDVNGISQPGQIHSSSWKNIAEAKMTIELIKDIRNNSEHGSIGVVTPFREQVDVITRLLESEGILENITIGAVNKFQGDERDIIIFSAVVSNGIRRGTLNWVQKPHNLINVALTRARDALYVICDYGYIRSTNGILNKLVKYLSTIDLLRRTSKYELDLYTWMIIQGWDPDVHLHIGDTEVDFLLKKRSIKLVIEVDGQQHDPLNDQIRDAYLLGQGYKVLRFKTRRIEEEIHQVLHEISEELRINFDYTIDDYRYRL